MTSFRSASIGAMALVLLGGAILMTRPGRANGDTPQGGAVSSAPSSAAAQATAQAYWSPERQAGAQPAMPILPGGPHTPEPAPSPPTSPPGSVPAHPPHTTPPSGPAEPPAGGTPAMPILPGSPTTTPGTQQVAPIATELAITGLAVYGRDGEGTVALARVRTHTEVSLVMHWSLTGAAVRSRPVFGYTARLHGHVVLRGRSTGTRDSYLPSSYRVSWPLVFPSPGTYHIRGSISLSGRTVASTAAVKVVQ